MLSRFFVSCVTFILFWSLTATLQAQQFKSPFSAKNITFEVMQPKLGSISGDYKSLSKQGDAYGTNFERTWGATGLGGEMRYSVMAKNSKLILDLSGKLDDSGDKDIFAYISSNVPSMYLPNNQPVRIDVKCDLSIDTTTEMHVPADYNWIYGSGGGSIRMMMIRVDNRIDHGNIFPVDKTQNISKKFKHNFSFMSYPEAYRAVIRDFRVVGYRTAIPYQIDTYLQKHPEIQSDPPEKDIDWTDSDIFHFNSDPNKSVFTAQAKGHIEITVGASNSIPVSKPKPTPKPVPVSDPKPTPLPKDDCSSCKAIVAQCAPSERKKANQLCHMLMGATFELSKYRDLFLSKPDFINLFPAVYHNVTKDDIRRLSIGEYSKPIPHMELMLAFFDAYKSNRIKYDNGKQEELHWSRYYSLAEGANENMTKILSNVPTLLPTDAQSVLDAGITAHVEYDLPRAIRYVHKGKRVNEKDKEEYLHTNLALSSTASQSTKDIYSALLKSRWHSFLTKPGTLQFFDKVWFKQSDIVISKRKVAWTLGVANGPLPTSNRPQPITNHAVLEREGKLHCN